MSPPPLNYCQGKHPARIPDTLCPKEMYCSLRKWKGYVTVSLWCTFPWKMRITYSVQLLNICNNCINRITQTPPPPQINICDHQQTEADSCWSLSLFVSFQSNRASADPLLPQRWPVPWRCWLGLRGNHALSPRVTGALPATGPTCPAPNGGPCHAHFPAKREREGTREGAAAVQRRRWKWWGRKEWGGTGSPDRLKKKLLKWRGSEGSCGGRGA